MAFVLSPQKYLTQIGRQDFSVSYGKEKSFNFSHIDKNDCRVFSELAKYSICLSFVLPRQVGVGINSYRIVFRNFFLLELISACQNNDMKLYAMTMKFPHASVAQKLFVTQLPYIQIIIITTTKRLILSCSRDTTYKSV